MSRITAPEDRLFRDTSFPDPYRDMASLALPTSIDEALEWGEYIYNTNGVYRSALKRVAAYCITDIEVVPAKAATSALDQKKREKYLKIFTSPDLDAKKLGVEFATSLLVYGNVFVTMHTRFTRYLECPNCHAIIKFSTAAENSSIDFEFRDFNFVCTCPGCKKRNNFIPSDEYSKKPEDLYVRFWDPHDIKIKYDKFTGDTAIIWVIPRDYRSLIREGVDLETLDNCPLNVINIIKEDQDLRFDKNVILHSKEGALPGVRAEGWGIPSVIPNFRAAWYWQLINKYNEVFATDFIMPTRCVSPASQGNSPADPVLNSGMDSFVDEMNRMIRTHEKAPNSWLVSPYPIQYQTLGGDAAQFLPREQLEHGKNTLLSSIGIPVDMYEGTMQLQAAPCALRLFESNWAWLISAIQRFLQFMATRAAFYMGEETVELRYKRISHADDLSRQQAIMQLGSAGEISRRTMLSTLGIDKQEEMQMQLEEDKEQARLQEEQQEDLQTMQMFKEMVPGGVAAALQDIQAQQQAQEQGGPPPGPGGAGAPPPAGGMPPVAGGMMPGMGGTSPIDQLIAQSMTMPTDSPEELQAKASTLAQQAMQMGPQRASFLRKLKSKDPNMHALVKSMVEDFDQQAASEGRQMVLQQQFGGG